MKQPFSATLTGSDSPITGIVKQTSSFGSKDTWQFNSIDDSLHLVIAKDENGRWQRITGTEPYLSGWTDELAQQINKHS
ncbi:MAG: hypothetical protein JWP44_4730 [Mucilaginibacter sp.]|nr:hypothetical protein [Mucilaginibacter sp.]